VDFFTHLISSIGNSLFGGGNNNNVSSNDQKRKQDQQQPGFNANPSVSTPSTNLSAATPSAPRVIKPKALGPDLSGLSDSDAATAKDLISRGKNATGFITAARNDAVAKNNARIANDPVNKVLNTGVEVAKTAVIDPVVNTAKSLGDMGVATFGDVTGNRRLSQEGKRNFERDFEGSIGGMILNPLKTIGTSAAAALAGRDLLNKGIDPTIVQNAMNEYTAPAGVSTNQSTLQNSLAIGSAAGQTALNLAGADAILRPKPIRVGAADEAAADLANVADEVPVVPKVETAPVEPVPVEAGIKPPKVAPAVKTPTEVVANTPAPVEAGVKAPNLVTATVPGGARSRMPAVETQPITPEVARAEAAAQQVVDKAADTVPQSNPAPVDVAPVETAGQAASKEAATNTPSSLPTAPREIPVIEHDRSMAAGKPSVKGSSDARYNTEDENLDRIGKSSLIAEKGTAKTAGAHADELANKGFSKSDVRQMRNWIVKNADANGHYDSKSFKSFVEGLLNKADAPQGITDKQFADAGIPDFGDAPKTPGDAPATAEAQMSGTPVTSGRSAVNKVFPIDEEFDRRGTLIDINSTEDDLIDALYELRGTPVEGRSLSDTKRIRAIEQALKDGTPRPKAATSDNPLSPIEADAPATGKLGTITRQAVKDGSINTPEGVAKAISDTTTAARAEAEAAGDSIENIIKKGQTVWETNPEATTKEASEIVKDFTPAQQQVYKDYAQELTTLRKRSTQSLYGGNQGAWYAPRQFLDEEGASRAYDSSLVNEIKRTGKSKTDTEGNSLDYSTTPFEHYIQRYADAADAGTQRMVGAVEEHGIKMPEESKSALKESLGDITRRQDDAERALAETGDKKAYDKLQSEIQKDVRKAFDNFIDEIPGTGAAKRAAVNDVKALRGTYEQTLSQTVTLSNIGNRIADQGTKGIEALKRPLVQGLKKGLNPIVKAFAPDTFEKNALNVTNEARQAAKEFSRGTLMHEIADNFKATVSNAGAGRNPLVKAIAKTDAGVRATGSATTQMGDLSTSNVRDALEIGASRPEAAGLKTVQDYKKYFADYVKTQKFKDDLASVERTQNPKIGLAGGEIQENGGKVSTWLSKNVDNGLRTYAESKKAGLGNNRLVREVNDYVKGTLTGYAGVSSRVLGSVADAALPIRPLVAVAKEAASGDPVAVARATNMAAHAVADTIALYGAGAGTKMLVDSGVIGFTGPQAKQGSSESSFNKSRTIPANQFYLNLPDGNRLYFDPARPFGAPGVAADIAGSVATGAKDLGGTMANIGGQLFNQSGGNSIPENIVNIQKGYLDPSVSESEKKYARARTESLLAPSTGFLNNLANWTDGVKRAPENFSEFIQSNIPGMRQNVNVAKDSMGNDIPNSQQISGGSSIFSVGKNPDAVDANGNAADPIGAEINRLQKSGQKNVMPTNANTNAKAEVNTELAKLLLQNDSYKAADAGTQADILHQVLIGKTKDINTSLSNDDKMALLDYKLQGKKGTVWLEDNNNNLRYLGAKINNDLANGTMTKSSPDMDMGKKGSLAQKYTIAKVNAELNVPQELKNSYADTTKAELYKLDANSQEYKDLVAYDKALAEAGLPSKYQNKYGTYSGSGGSGGSRLPSPGSLVIQPKQIGALSPDTTPVEYKMPSLQTYTPGGKVNPYIRSISTSKGVK